MMTKRLFIFIFLFLSMSSAHAEWINQEHTSVRLVSEYQTINGKQPFWLLVEFKIQPNWHTYWKNPGDFGLAPTFKFRLPEGFKVSKPYWLPPQKIYTGKFVNYGYNHKAYHLFKVTPPPSISPPFIPIELDASWLVCDKECIPDKANLTLNLSKGRRNIPSQNFDLVKTISEKLEHPFLQAKASKIDGKLLLQFQQPFREKIDFFPEQKGVIEPGGHQEQSIQNGKTWLYIASGATPVKYPVSGLLAVKKHGNTKYYNVTAEYTKAPEQALFLPMLLVFALLGGLILNLMPCVFPVLSLKILALKSSTNKRLQGLFYTLGVVMTFCVIAGMMISLQSIGKNIGWGFQLQSPLFNISLIFLFILIALNLFGFFEIPFSVSANLSWQRNHKYLYSFATGVLACIVATPCSAPFMATAIGVALSKTPGIAMLIFMFLGLGLALPYLLICFIPAVSKLLPKPGPWMETIKQLLAFPMLLSAIWLFWVLGQQVQYEVIMLILTSICGLLFAFWLKQRLKNYLLIIAGIIFSLLLILYPLYIIEKHQLLSKNKAMPEKTFSQKRLNQLLKQKKKVFVYATAAWCITCKANEKFALDTPKVQAAFKNKHIKVLKADWTNRDDSILKYLQSFGRVGVPLYVYYQPDSAPVILPQIISPGIIIDAIKN